MRLGISNALLRGQRLDKRGRNATWEITSVDKLGQSYYRPKADATRIKNSPRPVRRLGGGGYRWWPDWRLRDWCADTAVLTAAMFLSIRELCGTTHECGKEPHLSCPHCKFKTKRTGNVKGHVRRCNPEHFNPLWFLSVQINLFIQVIPGFLFHHVFPKLLHWYSGWLVKSFGKKPE